MTSDNGSQKAVVVTGASGGVGQELVAALARRGYLVFAASRNLALLEPLSGAFPSTVVPLPLDILSAESIATAAERVRSHCGVLNGLVNNAGVIVEGPIDLISVESLRYQFDVNVIGQMAVTKAFLPLLSGGRGAVVNIGAATAHASVPFFGAVSASKAALASLTDAMRMELGPLGINVSLVEPGALETAIFATAAEVSKQALRDATPEKRSLYGAAMESMHESQRKSGADKPAVVVKAVLHALTHEKPRTRYLVGKGAGALALISHLPDRMRDGILMGQLGIKKSMEIALSQPLQSGATLP